MSCTGSPVPIAPPWNVAPPGGNPESAKMSLGTLARDHVPCAVRSSTNVVSSSFVTFNLGMTGTADLLGDVRSAAL
jgi:hypothetical protein